MQPDSAVLQFRDLPLQLGKQHCSPRLFTAGLLFQLCPKYLPFVADSLVAVFQLLSISLLRLLRDASSGMVCLSVAEGFDAS